MDARLTPDQERVRAAVQRVCAAAGYQEHRPGELAPPAQVRGWRELAELGFFGWACGAGDDGPARRCLAVVAIEELGRCLLHGPHQDTLTASALVAVAGASPLLDRLASGDVVAALGPPGPVRGRRDAEPVLAGDRLEGALPFVGWAASADLLVLGARDAAGEPLLLAVPLPAEGVELRRQDDVSRGELYVAWLAGARVPLEGVLLRGDAATTAWRASMPAARLRHAAYLVGMAQGALDATLEYVRRRQAFGRRLGSFQSLAFRLAALHVRIDAVRLLVRATAWAPDGAETELRSHQAHAMAVEVADDAATDGLQMHGAHGLTEEAAIQRYYRHCAIERARLGRPAEVRSDLRAAFVSLRAAPQPE